MENTDIENENSARGNQAKSTLPPDHDSGDLVEIFSIDDKKNRGENRERAWIHDVLDDFGIPYRVELTGGWAGGKRYVEVQRVLVEAKNRETVLKLIMEYNNPGNFMKYKPDEDDDIAGVEDGMPMRICRSCGSEIDFDYHKCPFCKAKVD